MRDHLTEKARYKVHLLLAAVLATCALVVVFWPSVWKTVGSAAATALAVHAGVAAAIHVGVAVAGIAVLIALLRSHRHSGHGTGAAVGATLHSPRLYDWFAEVYCLGQEGRMRERTLDVAGVVAGEHALDVCCGTGTLALAAKRRVGKDGSVCGIDASEEMIARAKAKSARGGLPVSFQVAPAQALPFPDAAFDVVLCTLALHHLPEEARAGAIDEMRRVAKPGGRVLIVEIDQVRGLGAVLHPVSLLHGRKSRQILDGAVDLLKRAGFGPVVTGPLGSGGLSYALARGDA